MVKGAANNCNGDDEKCANEVTEEDKEPVFEELVEFDFALEKCHDHEVIPCEKFTAGNYDHSEASGEDAGAGDFATINIAEGGTDTGRRDEHTGENTKQNHFPPR